MRHIGRSSNQSRCQHDNAESVRLSMIKVIIVVRQRKQHMIQVILLLVSLQGTSSECYFQKLPIIYFTNCSLGHCAPDLEFFSMDFRLVYVIWVCVQYVIQYFFNQFKLYLKLYNQYIYNISIYCPALVFKAASQSIKLRFVVRFLKN